MHRIRLALAVARSTRCVVAARRTRALLRPLRFGTATALRRATPGVRRWLSTAPAPVPAASNEPSAPDAADADALSASERLQTRRPPSSLHPLSLDDDDDDASAAARDADAPRDESARYLYDESDTESGPGGIDFDAPVFARSTPPPTDGAARDLFHPPRLQGLRHDRYSSREWRERRGGAGVASASMSVEDLPRLRPERSYESLVDALAHDWLNAFRTTPAAADAAADGSDAAGAAGRRPVLIGPTISALRGGAVTTPQYSSPELAAGGYTTGEREVVGANGDGFHLHYLMAPPLQTGQMDGPPTPPADMPVFHKWRLMASAATPLLERARTAQRTVTTDEWGLPVNWQTRLHHLFTHIEAARERVRELTVPPPWSAAAMPIADPAEVARAQHVLDTALSEMQSLFDVVRGYATLRQWQQLLVALRDYPKVVEQYFRALNAHSILSPDTNTFNIVMETLATAVEPLPVGAAAGGEEGAARVAQIAATNTVYVDRVVEYFREMKARELPFDLLTYMTLIKAFSRSGDVVSARAVFDQLQTHAARAAREHAARVAAARKAPSFTPKRSTFAAALRTGGQLPNPWRGDPLAVPPASPAPADVAVYHLLIAAYARVGDWTQVLQMAKLMREAGVAADQSVSALMLRAAADGVNDRDVTESFLRDLQRSRVRVDSHLLRPLFGLLHRRKDAHHMFAYLQWLRTATRRAPHLTLFHLTLDASNALLRATPSLTLPVAAMPFADPVKGGAAAAAHHKMPLTEVVTRAVDLMLECGVLSARSSPGAPITMAAATAAHAEEGRADADADADADVDHDADPESVDTPSSIGAAKPALSRVQQMALHSALHALSNLPQPDLPRMHRLLAAAFPAAATTAAGDDVDVRALSGLGGEEQTFAALLRAYRRAGAADRMPAAAEGLRRVLHGRPPGLDTCLILLPAYARFGHIAEARELVAKMIGSAADQLQPFITQIQNCLIEAELKSWTTAGATPLDRADRLARCWGYYQPLRAAALASASASTSASASASAPAPAAASGAEAAAVATPAGAPAPEPDLRSVQLMVGIASRERHTAWLPLLFADFERIVRAGGLRGDRDRAIAVDVAHALAGAWNRDPGQVQGSAPVLEHVMAADGGLAQPTVPPHLMLQFLRGTMDLLMRKPPVKRLLPSHTRKLIAHTQRLMHVLAPKPAANAAKRSSALPFQSAAVVPPQDFRALLQALRDAGLL